MLSVSSGWLGDPDPFRKLALFYVIYVCYFAVLGRAKVRQHGIQSQDAGICPSIPQECEDRAAETTKVEYLATYAGT